METQYGKWKVISREGTNWLCECECGTQKRIRKYNLLHKLTRQCKTCAYASRKKPHSPMLKTSFLTITYEGITLTVVQWAMWLNISSCLLYKQLKQHVPEQEVFSTLRKRYVGKVVLATRLKRVVNKIKKLQAL
jgi:hypothetical protein